MTFDLSIMLIFVFNMVILYTSNMYHRDSIYVWSLHVVEKKRKDRDGFSCFWDNMM